MSRNPFAGLDEGSPPLPRRTLNRSPHYWGWSAGAALFVALSIAALITGVFLPVQTGFWFMAAAMTIGTVALCWGMLACTKDRNAFAAACLTAALFAVAASAALTWATYPKKLSKDSLDMQREIDRRLDDGYFRRLQDR